MTAAEEQSQPTPPTRWRRIASGSRLVRLERRVWILEQRVDALEEQVNR